MTDTPLPIGPPGLVFPLADVTLDQLRTLLRTSRRPTVPDLADEISVSLHEEHARMADRWAAEQGGDDGFIFIDCDGLAARVLNPAPFADDERRRIAVNALDILGAPVTDATVDAVLDITSGERP